MNNATLCPICTVRCIPDRVHYLPLWAAAKDVNLRAKFSISASSSFDCSIIILWNDWIIIFLIKFCSIFAMLFCYFNVIFCLTVYLSEWFISLIPRFLRRVRVCVLVRRYAFLSRNGLYFPGMFSVGAQFWRELLCLPIPCRSCSALSFATLPLIPSGERYLKATVFFYKVWNKSSDQQSALRFQTPVTRPTAHGWMSDCFWEFQDDTGV